MNKILAAALAGVVFCLSFPNNIINGKPSDSFVYGEGESVGEYYESPVYAELSDKSSGNGEIGAFVDYKTLADSELTQMLSYNSAQRQQLVTDLMEQAGTVYVNSDTVDFTNTEYEGFLNYAAANSAELERYLNHYGISVVTDTPITVDFGSRDSFEISFYRDFLINAYNMGITSIILKNKDMGVMCDLVSFAPLIESSRYTVSLAHTAALISGGDADAGQYRDIYTLSISDNEEITEEITDAHMVLFSTSDDNYVYVLTDNGGGTYSKKIIETEYDGQNLYFPIGKTRIFYIDENTESYLPYKDVDKTFWAYDYIEALTDDGIISGNSDGSFMPNSEITREEFVSMIARVLNLQDSGEGCGFQDVDKEDWCYSYICAAFQAGIIWGNEENCFGTGNSISRQDIAVIVRRAIEYTIPDTMYHYTEPYFEDAADISPYAFHSVGAMQSKGIFEGDEENKFNPQNGATRAEAAKIIYLMQKILQERI